MSTFTTFHNSTAVGTDRFGNDLRRAHEELDHLVRALSHDMNANFMLLESSFSQLKGLLPSEQSAELAERIAHVDACLEGSRQFLDDLVRLGKTGSVEMEPQRVDVAGVLDEVFFEQRELIEGKRCQIDVERPLPTIWCNRQRAKQIITNLIRNALHHGCDPQRPRITVSGWMARDRLAGRLTACLRVHDNGPGVDRRMHEEIFLPGRRLPGVTSEGTGMGLAIVRKIAEHYGGAARVDADCPSGTAMLVLFPSGRSAPRAEKDSPLEPEERGQDVESDGPRQGVVTLPRGLHWYNG